MIQALFSTSHNVHYINGFMLTVAIQEIKMRANGDLLLESSAA